MLTVSFKKLNAVMLERGLTITDMAATAKVSPTRVAQLIKRDSPANNRTIHRLATALNVPASALLINGKED